MAEEKVNIVYSLKDKASKGIGKLSNGFKTLAKIGIAGAVAGLVAFGALMKKASGLATVQEDAINNLNSAMKNNGTFTQEASQRSQDFAAALQQQSIFGDEAIISAQSMLVSLAGLSEDGLEEATQATADLSARLGIDLNTAAQLVGKTLGSSTNAMSRYGVQVEGAVGSTERLESLTNNVATLFGGAAKAQSETFSGSVKQLSNAFGDVLEIMGQATNEGLTPFISKMADMVRKLKEIMPDLIQGFKIGMLNIQTGIKIRMAMIKELIMHPFSFDTYKTVFAQLVKESVNVFKNMWAIIKKGGRGLADFTKALMLERATDTVTLAEKIEQIEKESAEKELQIIAETNELKNGLYKEDEDNLETSEKNKTELTKTELDKRAQLDKDAKAVLRGAFDSFNDETMTAEQKIGDAVLNILKNTINAQIDAWAVAESTKATLAAPLSFGATLFALAPIAAAAAAGKALVNSIKLAEGGSFIADSATQGNLGGQPIEFGEAGRERVTFEPLDGGGKEVIILSDDGTMLAKGIYKQTTRLLRTGQLQARRS